jgi:hypothetical protein
MSTVYAIKEDGAGMWCICCAQIDLGSRLTLAQAIKQARQLARDRHVRSGFAVSVELISPEGAITLAQYSQAGGAGEGAQA